jgi:hypothetical protein
MKEGKREKRKEERKEDFNTVQETHTEIKGHGRCWHGRVLHVIECCGCSPLGEAWQDLVKMKMCSPF